MKSELDNSYYIGQTENLSVRLNQHNNSSKKSTYTYKKRPWNLIYSEEFNTRVEAMRREKYLKNSRSKAFLEKIMGL